MRSKEAVRAFWVQMKANEAVSKGIRLKEMPEGWFVMPDDEAMRNSIMASLGVLACNRLVDEHRFEEADTLTGHLLSIDSGIAGLYRSLMICDRIFIELIGGNRADVLAEMLTKDQKKFMKAMKQFPSVIRTEYAYALLAEKDAARALEFEQQFECCAAGYPYPNDIEAERELMLIARESGDVSTDSFIAE